MRPEVRESLDVIRNWLVTTKETISHEPHMTNDEKKQLQAVNRSIEQLQKLGVSIPDDLRKLKLQLTSRDSSASSNQKIESTLETLEELIESLRDLKDEAKRIRHSLKPGHKGSGTKTHFGVRLVELMEAGLLTIESRLELQWRKDGDIYEGKLRPDGRIAVRTTAGWEEYDSLSTAASQISGRSQNGWEKWCLVESNGRHVPLIHIRDRYIKER